MDNRFFVGELFSSAAFATYVSTCLILAKNLAS